MTGYCGKEEVTGVVFILFIAESKSLNRASFPSLEKN